MNTEETKNVSPAGSAQAALQPADIEELEKVAGGALCVKLYAYRCAGCDELFQLMTKYNHPIRCPFCGQELAKCIE